VLTDYQHGRLGRVIAALPGLIKSAQALEETSGLADPRPWIVSARIHHLAATTLAKIGEADLAWIAAERAMSAAERSDDPLSLASAARAGTHALLSVGRYDDAVNLGQTAAEWLAQQVDQNDPAALSITGMLHLRTAIAAAHRQDRGTTTTLLAAADQAASRLGHDANYWHTSFGPTNVQLHRVAASLDPGDVAWVVEHGSQVDASDLPAERSVAHRVDLARAYSYVARDDDALAELLDAEAAAPQIVRHSAGVRETVKTLHPAPGTTPTRPHPCSVWPSAAEPSNDQHRDRGRQRRRSRDPENRPGPAACRRWPPSRDHPHPHRR
jgi:tetratricopeptide (TPR) repeat protein